MPFAAKMLVMGIAFLLFGVLTPKFGFWFRGVHVEGALAKILGVVAALAGISLICVAVINR